MTEPRLFGIKRRLKSVLLPAVFLIVAVLFGWNTITGDRGLAGYPERQELLRRVAAVNEAARAERDAWEHKVAGLRAHTLDPDALDERAREILNRAHPRDIIIQHSQQDRLF